jgi:hypothetical protein
LPPYIVFCAANANLFARGSRISALIAKAIRLPPAANRRDQETRPARRTQQVASRLDFI